MLCDRESYRARQLVRVTLDKAIECLVGIQLWIDILRSGSVEHSRSLIGTMADRHCLDLCGFIGNDILRQAVLLIRYDTVLQLDALTETACEHLAQQGHIVLLQVFVHVHARYLYEERPALVVEVLENDRREPSPILLLIDNVPNESFFNGQALCLSDGTIVMVATDHVVTFNPSKMSTIKEDGSVKLYPKLIKLMVNGIDIRTGDEMDGNVILEKAITRVYEINLNYNQNSLSLTFSALNFFRPCQTYYRVRVKGLIDDWQIFTSYNSGGMVDSRGLLHLPMMSLRPGSYEIELQASMNPYKWETTPYKWVVNVHEPWWRTSVMIVIYCVLLLLLIGVNTYFYLKNANMKAMRNSGEVNLLKRIISFSERCSLSGHELFEPSSEEVVGDDDINKNELDPEFIDMMVKIIPTVQKTNPKQLSMRLLSEEAGFEVKAFYSMVTSNIYKSPRPLAIKMMLDHAIMLMKTTDKSLEEISTTCGFVSPNYFTALFYRSFKTTPKEFRVQQ